MRNPTIEKNYRRYTTKSEAHKAFNSLSGIIQGITLDRQLNQKEIQELDTWCSEHEFLVRQNPFNELISTIQVIISDNVVTLDELEDMRWLCDKFKDGFEYYNFITSDLQVLQGIFHGILADGVVNEQEVKALNHWLTAHQHLESYYPFDEIYALITNVLQDGVVDEQEKKLLKVFFTEFTKVNNPELTREVLQLKKEEFKIDGICAIDPKIKIKGHQFCFTGKSSQSTRAEIAEIIQSKAGVFINNVSKKTNYLLVGDDGNPCWSYSCYGRKVEKAMQLRKQGAQVLIVHEYDFWDFLEG